jgi:hypothetical protein
MVLVFMCSVIPSQNVGGVCLGGGGVMLGSMDCLLENEDNGILLVP